MSVVSLLTRTCNRLSSVWLRPAVALVSIPSDIEQPQSHGRSVVLSSPPRISAPFAPSWSGLALCTSIQTIGSHDPKTLLRVTVRVQGKLEPKWGVYGKGHLEHSRAPSSVGVRHRVYLGTRYGSPNPNPNPNPNRSLFRDSLWFLTLIDGAGARHI